MQEPIVEDSTERDRDEPRVLSATLFRGATGVVTEVRVTRSHLLLSIDQEAYELSTDRLECRAGGHNDATIFLRHPSLPDAEITLDRTGAKVLDHLPQVQAAIAAAPRLVRRQRLFWTIIAAGALIGMGLLLTVLIVLGRALI